MPDRVYVDADGTTRRVPQVPTLCAPTFIAYCTAFMSDAEATEFFAGGAEAARAALASRADAVLHAAVAGAAQRLGRAALPREVAAADWGRAVAAAAQTKKPRLVTDYKRSGLNGAGMSWPFAFFNASDMIANIAPGAFVASDDIKAFFNIVANDVPLRVFRACCAFGRYFLPTTMAFGERVGPAVGCSLSAEICEIAEVEARATLGAPALLSDAPASLDTPAALHEVGLREEPDAVPPLLAIDPACPLSGVPVVRDAAVTPVSAASRELTARDPRTAPGAAQPLDRAVATCADGPSVSELPYVDDLFHVGASERLCQAMASVSLEVCTDVKAFVALLKRRKPSQRNVELLGLLLDTVRMTISLPPAKRYKYALFVALMLRAAVMGVPVPKDHVRKVAGQLVHAVSVYWSAARHVAPLWRGVDTGSSQVWVDSVPGLVAALSRWSELLTCDARSASALVPSPAAPFSVPRVSSCSDAAGSAGCAITMGPLVLWIPYAEGVDVEQEDEAGRLSFSIQGLEQLPWLALAMFVGKALSGFWWQALTDNLPNCFAYAKWYSRNACMAAVMAAVQLAQERYGYLLVPGWLPREFNTFMDEVSKKGQGLAPLVFPAHHPRMSHTHSFSWGSARC